MLLRHEGRRGMGEMNREKRPYGCYCDSLRGGSGGGCLRNRGARNFFTERNTRYVDRRQYAAARSDGESHRFGISSRCFRQRARDCASDRKEYTDRARASDDGIARYSCTVRSRYRLSVSESPGDRSGGAFRTFKIGVCRRFPYRGTCTVYASAFVRCADIHTCRNVGEESILR